MSLQNKIVQNCPHCEHTQELFFYNSVNVTLDPSLKELVLDRKLNSQTCTNCGEDINIMGDFLYHDMQQKIMIQLNTQIDTKEVEALEMYQELKANGYIYRLVRTYSELIEKIKIFDAEMNDHAIASIKSGVTEMLQESLTEVVEDVEAADIQVYFDHYEKSIFKKKLVFVFFLDPSQMMLIQYDVKKLSKPERRELFNMNILRLNA